jgi:sulfur-oxidizing protein SoxZ
MNIARVAAPETARRGETIEVKTLCRHVMETGYRRDDMGKPIPRDILRTFIATWNGAEIFRADLSQGIAANPFIAFEAVATESGEIVCTWTDLSGKTIEARARITVT